MQCKSDGNMEDVVTENVCGEQPSDVAETQETHDVKNSESAENFQKFMYELFEKNGVINDLRAYLRGHIVGILRSTRTGDPPPCQKHFTQRLEHPYQALNMLVAEYLLRLEFSYTLSVFISEIPLANMVLDFARSLMQGSHSDTMLRFKDEDVWSILNYLGVKCDSDYASHIVEMYREDTQSPLLLCMLKYMPMFTPIGLDKVSSQESLSSSVKSSDTLGARLRSHRSPSRCKHLAFCKTCHGKMLRIKESYRKKKKTLAKNTKESSVKLPSVESLMKNIDVIEKSLIDEMFQQLKSVYEAEMQMAKNEEEERVKRSIASHAVQLNRKRMEMEEQFKARESELAHSVQQKKRFLWGLARLLRDQHQQMARAMLDVQAETTRLSAKEDSLKSQLAEAEAILRSRGEEMRRQISAELATLEGHLDSMKRERDTINQQRSELERLKNLCDVNTTPNIETTKEDLRSHYDLLKNEFTILKKYLETAKLEPKCVIERSTITDETRVGALNNGHELDKCRSDDKIKAKQVVNDLKKMKNVNFSQSNLAEIYRERSRSSASHSTVSSEGGDARDACDAARDARDATRRLLEENERLRTFARQQREHIDELSSQQAPAHRPRTAPAAVPLGAFSQGMAANANASQLPGHGWRKGAGEEMSFFSNAQPRILVPGDPVPFIGVMRERHTDNRRYLINQWRALRRRMSPVSGAGRQAAAAAYVRELDKERPNSADPSLRLRSEEDLNNNSNVGVNLEHSYELSRDQYEQRPKSAEKSMKIYENASILREANERLKTKEYRQTERGQEAPPSAVIRDAKLRLRKLEIEAEAVERSYLHFRRNQEARRAAAASVPAPAPGPAPARPAADHDIDLRHELPSLFAADQSRIESTSRYIPQEPACELIIEDIDEYRAKYDIGVTHFKNKNATPMRVRPIPASATFEATKTNQNYLETSMVEFRKYYHSEKRDQFFEETPITSQARSRGFDPPTPSRSQRLAGEDRPASNRHRKLSSKITSMTSPSHEHSNKPNSPRNKNIKPISTCDDVTTRSTKIKKKIGFKSETRQTKHDKEFEILKQNISKIYNLSETTVAENTDNYNEAVENAKREMENERKGIIIEETITEVSRGESTSDPGSKDPDDKNLLRIEVQSVSKVSDVKITESQTQDLLLVVESSNVAENSDYDYQQDVTSTQMTILLTPKSNSEKSYEASLKSPVNSSPAKLSEKSMKLSEKSMKLSEKSMKLSEKSVKQSESVKQSRDDVLNSLYEADANEKISSIQMQLENSKDVLVPFLSDGENEEPEYPDNYLSTEIDNFNSLRYDTDHELSPISVVKTSEDDNFWDS